MERPDMRTMRILRNTLILLFATGWLVSLVACGGGVYGPLEDEDADAHDHDVPSNDDVPGDADVDMSDADDADARDPDDTGDTGDAGDREVHDADAHTGDTDAGEPDPPPAYWPEEGLTLIHLDANGRAEIEATFAGADPLADVAWARNPDVACWSNVTIDEFYSARHVGFALADSVGPWQEITVTIVPDDRVEANVYVLRQDEDRFDVPPSISSARYCHRPTEYGGIGESQSVTFRTYGDQTRNFYIGVSNRGRFGPEGNFRLEVEVTPVSSADQCYAEMPVPFQWPDHVHRIALDDDGSWVGTGQLSEGAPPCSIQFINDSFCAPSTQFEHFEGNHVFYALDAPQDRQTITTITVVPDPGVVVSLYASRQGAGTSFEVPPGFPTSLCDASYSPSRRNPGEPESVTLFATTNPYNIFFAVATDAEQGAEGGYSIVIDTVNTSTDHCTEEEYLAVTGLDDWPAHVQRVSIDPSTGVGSVRGDLRDGDFQCTLDWAARSSTACFPLTQHAYFDGRHVLYAIDPPPPAGSDVHIHVYPDDDVDVSVYGYRVGTTSFPVPPALYSAINCEASYPIAFGDRPTNPGVTESISFYNPTPNAYNYVVGVAGYADELFHGEFTMEIIVEEPPPPHCPESLPGTNYPTWPTFVERIALDTDGHAEGTGDLASGSCTNLAFAAQSSVACFPATQFEHFEGNHVYFALDEPIPPGSEVTITVQPEPGVNLSVYGLQLGETDHFIPPFVPSGICRASWNPSGPNPGESQTIQFFNPTRSNSYNIMFAVAGDGDTGESGGFTYTVDRHVGEPFCEESLEAPPVTDTLPASVRQVALTDGFYEGSGTLSGGACVALEFAARSDVACFPATQFDKFLGNHVFYEIETPMPPRSFLDIEVTPRDDADINIYAFQLGDAGWPQLPPHVSNAICHASYGGGQPNPGVAERLHIQNPTPSSTYRILLAVAGPEGATDTEFDILIRMEEEGTHCPDSLPGQSYTDWPDHVTLVDLPEEGAPVVLSGQLDDGDCVNLDFAWRSDVACFPATQDVYYDGDHVFYALREPLPPRSSLDIRMTPNAGGDLSLYGFQMGAASFVVPPFVTPLICHASNPTYLAGPNPGETERIHFQNPSHTASYNIFFAVAGGSAASAGTGAFELELVRDP